MISRRMKSSRTYSMASERTLLNQRSACGTKRFSAVTACEPYGSPGIQCSGASSQRKWTFLGSRATSSGVNASATTQPALSSVATFISSAWSLPQSVRLRKGPAHRLQETGDNARCPQLDSNRHCADFKSQLTHFSLYQNSSG